MDKLSHQKVVKAGFIIIRTDDSPSPRIKVKDKKSSEWRTLEKFETKTARDKRFKEYLESSDFIIQD